MSAIKVVAIDTTHAQTLTDLGRRLFADTFSSANKPENMETYLDEAHKLPLQLKELSSPHWQTFMAFDGETAVGYAQLRQEGKVYDFIQDDDAIELHRIYVDKTYQGKGVGKLLIDACLAKARELNKKTIWLGVWEFNPKAIAFYERLGFYTVGSHIFKLGEQEDTDLVLVKKL